MCHPTASLQYRDTKPAGTSLRNTHFQPVPVVSTDHIAVWPDWPPGHLAGGPLIIWLHPRPRCRPLGPPPSQTCPSVEMGACPAPDPRPSGYLYFMSCAFLGQKHRLQIHPRHQTCLPHGADRHPRDIRRPPPPAAAPGGKHLAQASKALNVSVCAGGLHLASVLRCVGRKEGCTGQQHPRRPELAWEK